MEKNMLFNLIKFPLLHIKLDPGFDPWLHKGAKVCKNMFKYQKITVNTFLNIFINISTE